MLDKPKVTGRLYQADNQFRLLNSQEGGLFSRLKNQEETGAILVIGVILAIGLTMAAISAANVGMIISQKMHLQDTVDAAAYSASVAQARYMNLTAYLNRAMVANYSAMAFNTSLWSVVAAYDHGVAAMVSLLYLFAGVLQLIPVVGLAAQPMDSFAGTIDQTVHRVFHQAHPMLDQMFSQDEGNVDFNYALELYSTEMLSNIQGFAYASIQSARHQIAGGVAGQMDEDVLTTSVLSLGTETITADELKNTVDWVIANPEDREGFSGEFNKAFNNVMGEDEDTDDHPLLLGAITEASLDRFTVGRDRAGNTNTLRNFSIGDFLPGFVETMIEIPLYLDCIASCALMFDCSCDTEVDSALGAQMRYGKENKILEDRVPVIANQRMREVDWFSFKLDFEANILNSMWSTVAGFLGVPDLGKEFGYTSGERHNDIENFVNFSPAMAADDFARVLECAMAGGDAGSCHLNKMNNDLAIITSFGIGALCTLVSDLMAFSYYDEHWDGVGDPMPTCMTRYFAGQIAGCLDEGIAYIMQVCSEGVEMGVPKYDWKSDLEDVGISHYIYDETDSERRPDQYSRGNGGYKDVFAGPSVAVFGIKKKKQVKGIEGLDLENIYDISASARGQVYYLRNPNREDEKPSMFNPHWVARLAPIDQADTPDFIEKGMSFLGGGGVPLKPTH